MEFIQKYGKYLGVGALAGFVNGLLGAGGGIIVTFFLSYALGNTKGEKNKIFANALATMLPISVLSLVLYITKGHLKLTDRLIYLIPSAIVGGILGAFLLTKLKFRFVKIIFAILVIVSGFSMLVR